MTPESLHDMFVASASVAGALIGLLFVAISVEHDRLVAEDADQVDRVRAAAALSSFTNALSVSLFGLIPGDLGGAAFSVGIIGILFVFASVLSVRRARRAARSRTSRLTNLTFLLALQAVYAFQIYDGFELSRHPHHAALASNLATLVIICFLLGIYRSWELIGGPDIGLRREVTRLVRDRVDPHGPSSQEPPREHPGERRGD